MKLLKFWAPWCGPCKAFAPVIESVTKELNIELRSLNVDEDDVKDLLVSFDVKSIPTIVLVEGEQTLIKHTGPLSEKDLRELLAKYSDGNNENQSTKNTEQQEQTSNNSD